jgi:hypothetical protein
MQLDGVEISCNCHREFFKQEEGLGAFWLRNMPPGVEALALQADCCKACKMPLEQGSLGPWQGRGGKGHSSGCILPAMP